VLEGSFAFTAGNARGPARAVRLTDGKMPEGVAAFACDAPERSEAEELPAADLSPTPDTP